MRQKLMPGVSAALVLSAAAALPPAASTGFRRPLLALLSAMRW
jgi:hypothetical protein